MKFILSFLSLLFLGCNTQSEKNINKIKAVPSNYSTPQIKDLTAKKFIEICTKSYDENTKINFVTFDAGYSGEFPKNWIKKEDLQYLINIINSKVKCCGFMSLYSSFISSENAEVGGYAILFLKSYMENKQINLGLNSNPKVDRKEAEIILNWYKNQK